ncbi:homing endonuclease [Caudoviricetes sp.]|nr:homing endonuclease [Caudoviricetes sp.]
MEEKWVPVVGYEENYLISNFGRIKNAKSDHVLTSAVDLVGYRHVSLCKKGISKTCKIHRLVAISFIGEPNGLHVNHKDGNKQNNHLSNLEYVTKRENTSHYHLSKNRFIGVAFLKNRIGKKVWRARTRLNGKSVDIGYYETQEDASKAYINFLEKNNIKNKYANGE